MTRAWTAMRPPIFLDGVRFELDDEEWGASRKVRARKQPPTRLSRSPRLWPAGSGLVEIDFDNLTFETDDE